MFRDYRVVCVTPAGRRRYMEILVPYILRSGIVDDYQIWANTTDADDLAFLRELCALDPRVSIREVPEYPVNGIHSIGQFFRYCTQGDCIYIRLDDDVVWLSDDFFEVLLNFRVEHPQYFLISPLIINNAMCTYLLQSKNIIRSRIGYVKPDAFDPIGWSAPLFSHHLHNILLHTISINGVNSLMFDQQVLPHLRFSINCICWFGREFAEFGGQIPQDADEEEWLSVTKPREIGRANCICGRAIASHFAFSPQRQYLDATDLLARYHALSVGAEIIPPPIAANNKNGSDILFQPTPNYDQLRTKFEGLINRGNLWRYLRSDGVIIADQVLLMPNGDIDRYFHFNESRWERRDGWICFVNEAGQPSTRFHRLEITDDGRMRATGIYLFGTVGFHHVLMQCDPATGSL